MATQREHAVTHINFKQGYVECFCGWVGSEPGYNYEEVAQLFASHRKEVNASRANTNVGYEGKAKWR